MVKRCGNVYCAREFKNAYEFSRRKYCSEQCREDVRHRLTIQGMKERVLENKIFYPHILLPVVLEIPNVEWYERINRVVKDLM